MNTRTLSTATAIALLAGTAAAQQSPTRYTVHDLGAGFNAYPTAVGSTGFVSGSFDDPAAGWVRRGFVWDGEARVSIGTLGGESHAAAVNAHAAVAGFSADPQNRRRAVRFAGGALSDLGTLTGGTTAMAFAINTPGWIVGQSETRIGTALVQRAALWRNGFVIDLGTLGGTSSDARAVSDTGFVAGWATTGFPAQQRAFRWSESGGMQNLGVLDNLSWQPSMAMDVNNHGVVVGMSGSLTGARAFAWTPAAGIQDLGVPAIPAAEGLGTEAWASGINDAGQVVGWSYYPDNQECLTVFVATLWDRPNGQVVDLSTRLDTPGWTLLKATDINDRGEISAIGYYAGGSAAAVLLRPVVGGGNCSPDFNGDGDFGTDQDVESFFACLAGTCCQTCGTSDFNSDGDFGTDADIESFFRVLAGGAC
jgi:probable HAF family extracellular repeat protein